MPRVAAPLSVLVLLALLSTGCGRLVTVEVTSATPPRAFEPEQTHVLAADGSLLAVLRFANRTVVERGDLPQVLVDAVVAAEDRRFYEHDGVDYRALVHAFAANRRAGEVVQGGSTITQQLVKNRYFPEAERTLERKAAEARLAREVEQASAKDEILVDYLNTVYLGAGAYGVQAAAETYFGVRVDALDLPQSALIAALLRAPESASPYAHPDRAVAERTRVLQGMVATKAIDAATAESVAAGELGVQPPPAPPQTRYPYFVEHVKRTLLADPRFATDEAARTRLLYGGGLRIHTTLDPVVQEAADAAALTLPDPDDPEVGIAVVRPSDGHLLAVHGGRDFTARQFDVATQGRRQPGSTMKTFALATALTDGRRLADRVDSSSAALTVAGDRETWSVRSQDQGLLDLQSALASSSNGVFARLAIDVGPERIADQARRMGIEADLGTDPAMVLGGTREGVSPLQMAGAYGTLANSGVAMPSTAVTRVTHADGDLVWSPPVESPTIAVDAEVAWFTTQALRAAVTDGTGRRADPGRPAAGKTGTTQDNRDAWFVGYTPELSAAVWVGHPDTERPLRDVHGVARVDGGSWPAEIWRQVVEAALAGQPLRDFAYPEGLVSTVRVDPTTGGLATPYCPFVVERTGLRGELPDFTCPLHTAPVPWLRPGDDASEGPADDRADEADDAPDDGASQPPPAAASQDPPVGAPAPAGPPPMPAAPEGPVLDEDALPPLPRPEATTDPV